MHQRHNNRLLNRLDSVIAICRKQTVICLFLDTAMQTVAYLRVAAKRSATAPDGSGRGPLSECLR